MAFSVSCTYHVLMFRRDAALYDCPMAQGYFWRMRAISPELRTRSTAFAMDWASASEKPGSAATRQRPVGMEPSSRLPDSVDCTADWPCMTAPPTPRPAEKIWREWGRSLNNASMPGSKPSERSSTELRLGAGPIVLPEARTAPRRASSPTPNSVGWIPRRLIRFREPTRPRQRPAGRVADLATPCQTSAFGIDLKESQPSLPAARESMGDRLAPARLPAPPSRHDRYW